GFFVNTLVVRGRIDRDEGFGALVERVRGSALAAQAHQDVPFERLVEELAPPRSASWTPLFQAMLTFRNLGLPPLELPGLAIVPEEVPAAAAKFDLTLSLGDAPGTVAGLSGRFEYATELFDPATAERLAGRFVRLLVAAVAAPEAPLGELALLAAPERAQLLVEWNDAAASGGDPLFPERFLAAAELRPDAVAAVAGDGEITYGELAARSERLARRLVGFGIGPEAPVALAFERTLDALVALIAVLRAGGAYLPLDPEWPRERAAAVIADSGAVLALAAERSAAALGTLGVPVLCLDEID